MFDIKSRKFESLSNILRDIRITHYMDKVADIEVLSNHNTNMEGLH